MVATKEEDLGKSRLPVVPVKRPTKQKKPKDKPKRPLSAYNFFFKEEREKILRIVNAEDPFSSEVQKDKEADDYLDEEAVGRLKKEGGKVSFEEMGKIIGARWKSIDPDRLADFQKLAKADTDRYQEQMKEYNARQEARMKVEASKPVVPPPAPASAGGYGAGVGGVPSAASSAYGAGAAGGIGSNPYGDMSAYGSAMGSMYGYPAGAAGGAADFSQYAAAMGYGAAMGMPYGGYDPSAFQAAAYPGGAYGMMGGLGAAGGPAGMSPYVGGAPGMGAYGGGADQYGQPPNPQADQYGSSGPPPTSGGFSGYGGQPGGYQG